MEKSLLDILNVIDNEGGLWELKGDMFFNYLVYIERPDSCGWTTIIGGMLFSFVNGIERGVYTADRLGQIDMIGNPM